MKMRKIGVALVFLAASLPTLSSAVPAAADTDTSNKNIHKSIRHLRGRSSHQDYSSEDLSRLLSRRSLPDSSVDHISRKRSLVSSSCSEKAGKATTIPTQAFTIDYLFSIEASAPIHSGIVKLLETFLFLVVRQTHLSCENSMLHLDDGSERRHLLAKAGVHLPDLVSQLASVDTSKNKNARKLRVVVIDSAPEDDITEYSCSYTNPPPGDTYCQVYMGQMAFVASHEGDVQPIIDAIIATIQDAMASDLLLKQLIPTVSKVRFIGDSIEELNPVENEEEGKEEDGRVDQDQNDNEVDDAENEQEDQQQDVTEEEEEEDQGVEDDTEQNNISSDGHGQNDVEDNENDESSNSDNEDNVEDVSGEAPATENEENDGDEEERTEGKNSQEGSQNDPLDEVGVDGIQTDQLGRSILGGDDSSSNDGNSNALYAMTLLPFGFMIGMAVFAWKRGKEAPAVEEPRDFQLFGTGDAPDSFHDGHYHYRDDVRYLSTNCPECLETLEHGYFTAPQLSTIEEVSTASSVYIEDVNSLKSWHENLEKRRPEQLDKNQVMVAPLGHKLGKRGSSKSYLKLDSPSESFSPTKYCGSPSKSLFSRSPSHKSNSSADPTAYDAYQSIMKSDEPFASPSRVSFDPFLSEPKSPMDVAKLLSETSPPGVSLASSSSGSSSGNSKDRTNSGPSSATTDDHSSITSAPSMDLSARLGKSADSSHIVHGMSLLAAYTDESSVNLTEEEGPSLADLTRYLEATQGNDFFEI